MTATRPTEGPALEGGWTARLRRTAARGPGTALFLAVAALLALGFFAEFVLQPGRMLFGTDMLEQAYQLRHFGVEEVKSGRGLPLWNPYVYGGLPYLGVLPGPVFYPTTLLYLLLPLFRAIGWTFVLHLFLAGGLGYAAARAFGLRRWSAAATGLAFMFAGYLVSTLYGGHDGRMFAMVLVPGVFACAERGWETGRWHWFVGMGLLVALQIFTPHVQVMYFSSLAVSLYVLFRLVTDWRAGDGRAGLVKAAGFAVGFVVAAAVGAVQLLPAVDLLQHAVRGGGQGGYEFASSWALPPQELTALFLPDLIGSLQGSYWGSNPFKLHTEYLGAGVLALAAVAVLTPRGDRRIWFLAGASAVGVAFSLGGATPVHRIAYEVVPLVDRFRAPAMMLGPVSFFTALLAGFGVERLLSARAAGGATAAADDDGGPGGSAAAGADGEVRSGAEGREGGGGGGELPWIWIWGASAPFLLLAAWAALSPDGLLRWAETAWFPPGWPRRPPQGLGNTLRATGVVVLGVWTATLVLGRGVARGRLPEWALAGVLVLLVADLWRVNARYLETVDPEAVFEADPVVERIRAGLGPGERAWPLEDTYSPNELMHWRIPSVTGMQNFRLEWYDRLVGGVQMEELLRRPALWPLFDVRYLTLRSPVETPLLREVTRAGGTALYELAVDLPHAFFPDSVVPVEDLEAALEATRSLEDPRSAALVEVRGSAARPPGAGRGLREDDVPDAGRGRARVVRWTPDEVALEVEAEEGGLLFVSEVFHPGWTAHVDGRRVPVHRVDGVFRGVVVPEGRHRVRLVFRSPAFRWGGLLSVVSLLGALGGIVYGRRRRSD